MSPPRLCDLRRLAATACSCGHRWRLSPARMGTEAGGVAVLAPLVTGWADLAACASGSWLMASRYGQHGDHDHDHTLVRGWRGHGMRVRRQLPLRARRTRQAGAGRDVTGEDGSEQSNTMATIPTTRLSQRVGSVRSEKRRSWCLHDDVVLGAWIWNLRLAQGQVRVTEVSALGR